MSRLPMFPVDDLTEAQRAIYDIVPRSASRRIAHGPILALLLHPELADPAQRLGAYFHHAKYINRRLRELAVLATARAWTAHYEWYAHAKAAEENGISPAAIEAIRTRGEPVFELEDEKIVYAVAHALHHEQKIPDQLYTRAVGAFTKAGVVELIALVGYYTYLAMLIRGFELEPPPGGPTPLAE